MTTKVRQSTLVSVANTQISGNIVSSQITSVANTQVIGLITSGQIATVANTQITGTVASANTITTPNFTIQESGGKLIVKYIEYDEIIRTNTDIILIK